MYYYYRSLQVIWNEVINLYGLQWIDHSDYDNLNDLIEPFLTGFECRALEDLTGLEFVGEE